MIIDRGGQQNVADPLSQDRGTVITNKGFKVFHIVFPF